MFFIGDSLSHFLVYEELDLVSMVVLLILLIHVLANRAHSSVNRIYARSCALAFAAIASDTVREIFIYKVMMPWAIILFSVLKAIMTLLVLQYWLRFSLTFLNVKLSAAQQFLLLLPGILAGTAYLLSFFGIGTFWAVAPGIYSRGPLFFMEPVGFCIYPFIQMLFYVHCSKKAVTKSMKADYFRMATFGIFPAAGALLQYVFGQAIPWIAPSIMLAVLQGYLVAENREINIDVLTGIPRRPALEHYIQDLLSSGELESLSPDSSKCWHFMMMDIDHFKYVNDTYGHLEGDHALQIAARTLQECFKSSRGTLARYGGDEFAAVMQGTELELKQLEENNT
ncbi:MAG: GGDEF domain-containing protein [Eubacterium sp.]|nr:GGDEF domain-containing protein [Eubacterium sp.]